MDVQKQIVKMQERHARELRPLIFMQEYLGDLPEPSSVSTFLWPSLDYHGDTPEDAETLVKEIQRATGIYLQRDVDTLTGGVRFEGSWTHSDTRVQFTVHGGVLAPTCHLEQEEVIIPERREMRFKVVCDDESVEERG